MRLNRFLASCGLGSRRGCESLIRDGRVEVNGEICTRLATDIGPGDEVVFEGRRLKPSRAVTIALHKPAGCITTRSDTHGRSTVYDFLPPEFRRLATVGRLDRDSEGLLLLTSDGDLANRLTHPSKHVPKTYLVTVDRAVEPRDAQRLVDGIDLPDGPAAAERVEILDKRDLEIILAQGMKRQIRLMLSELGYEVARLVRTRIGPLPLGDLRPGKWRRLSDQEVARLADA